MAVCNTIQRCVWPTLILLWVWMWEAGCDMQYQAEEEEIFHSDKQIRLGWKSDPPREWSEILLRVDTESRVSVLQACGKRITRTILSQWWERKDAHYLLMDVAFAQEEEPSGPLGPLQVHLFDSDTPITRFQNTSTVQDLQIGKPFPATVPPSQISSHLTRGPPLNLGSVSRRGFQLAFSYSGTCVLITSIRLYYRRCPDIEAHLVSFKRTGAGSVPMTGSCVKGAVEVSPPIRECDMHGVWGPLQGGCTCELGHQVIEDTCQVGQIAKGKEKEMGPYLEKNPQKVVNSFAVARCKICYFTSEVGPGQTARAQSYSERPIHHYVKLQQGLLPARLTHHRHTESPASHQKS